MKKYFLRNLFFAIVAIICFGITNGEQAHAQEETVAGIQSPVVFTSITPKTKKIRLYVEGEATLYVKSGRELLLKKYYKNDGIKTITISKQKLKTKLTFYVRGKRNGKMYTSKKVSTKVIKKAKKEPLKAAKLKFNPETIELTIKGKVGTTVYVRKCNGAEKGKWINYGVILNKRGITEQIRGFDVTKTYNSTEYYEVRLKDLNGKYSKKSKLDLTGYVPADIDVEINK